MSSARKLVGGLARVVKLLVGLALAAVFVGGVPYLLVRFVGNPVPGRLPAWDEVVIAAQSRQVEDSVVVQVLALVLWLVWAHLMVSLLVEIWAAARGLASSTVRGLGATQWLARRLVAQFTLTSTVVVQSAAALALPSLPHAADMSVPVVVMEDAAANNDDPGLARRSQSPELLVASGDTLWDLAKQHLGAGERWIEIRDANAGRTMPDGTVLETDFVTIQNGWTLVIPTGDADPVPSSPIVEASREIAATNLASESPVVIGAWRVEQGDHFWSMAETVLAKSWGRAPSEVEIREYWLDIISANRDHLISPGNDPSEIYVDQEFDILLPPLASAPSKVSGPEATDPVDSLAEVPQFVPASSLNGSLRAPDSDAGAGTVPESPVQDPVVSLVPPADPTASGDTEASSVGETGGGGSGLELPTIGAVGSLRVVGGVALSGAAAAGLIALLRSRRKVQAAQRRPGSVPSLPDPPHAEFERLVRSIAEPDRLRWLTATNKFISAAVAANPGSRLPAIVAVRAGEHGVEILLDEPLEPPRGFIPGEGPQTWVLDPAFEVEQLEHEAADRLPFAPMLLPVGDTQAGELLVDLAQLDVVNVEGAEAGILGWMRALAVAVDASAWSDQVRVIAIGVDPVLSRLSHVHVPQDPIAWAAEEVDRWRSGGLMADSGYERRLRGDDTEEVLVLVGPGHEGVAQHLVSVAELVNTPLTLLAAAPVAGEARVHFDADACTLEPSGLKFWPTVMTDVAVAMTTSLLDGAGETSSVPEDILYPDPESTGDSTIQHPLVGDVEEPEQEEFWQPPLSGDRLGPDPVARWEEPPAATSDDGSGTPLAPEPPVRPIEDPAATAVGIDEVAADSQPAEQWRSVERLESATIDPAAGGEPVIPPVAAVDPLDSDLDDVEGDGFGSGGGDPLLNSPVSVPLGESNETVMTIAEVLSPQPIEVAVLRETPEIVGVESRLTPKNQGVVAFLAFRRSVGSAGLREVFWPTSVARSTSDNAVSTIRRSLGDDAYGEPRLHMASQGRLSVSPEVGCDWARFTDLVELAGQSRQAGATSDEMACLRAALALVAGPIATEVEPKHWKWLRDDPVIYSAVETSIVDASYRLGELACDKALPELARWAAGKGLAVVPNQEALYRVQMRAAAIAGENVDVVFRAAERSAAGLGICEGVQPETEVLYRQLVGATPGSVVDHKGMG